MNASLASVYSAEQRASNKAAHFIEDAWFTVKQEVRIMGTLKYTVTRSGDEIIIRNADLCEVFTGTREAATTKLTELLK